MLEPTLVRVHKAAIARRFAATGARWAAASSVRGLPFASPRRRKCSQRHRRGVGFGRGLRRRSLKCGMLRHVGISLRPTAFDAQCGTASGAIRHTPALAQPAGVRLTPKRTSRWPSPSALNDAPYPLATLFRVGAGRKSRVPTPGATRLHPTLALTPCWRAAERRFQHISILLRRNYLLAIKAATQGRFWENFKIFRKNVNKSAV